MAVRLFLLMAAGQCAAPRCYGARCPLERKTPLLWVTLPLRNAKPHCYGSRCPLGTQNPTAMGHAAP